MKNLIYVILFLFSSNLSAQILNPSFEEWEPKFSLWGDSVPAPKIGSFKIPFWTVFLQDINSFEGNFALKLTGGFSATDAPVPSYTQQRFLIPHGLDSISFYAKIGSRFSDPIHPPGFDFYGYGLSIDTIKWGDFIWEQLVTGVTSEDTSSNYTKRILPVPDSLWGRTMHLTFYAYAIDWGTYPYFLIDNIQLHGDFSVNAQTTDNQQINIFPNPVDNFIFIKNEGLDFLTFDIFSPEGKLIFSGRKQTQIDVGGLPAGSYFLVLKNEDNASLKSIPFLKN